MTISTKIDAASARPEVPLRLLSGLTRTQLAALVSLGLETVGDLLFHLPFRYEDFTESVALRTLRDGDQVAVVAKLKRISSRRAFRKRSMSITDAVITDGRDDLGVTWFSQPYLSRSLKADETYRFAGKVRKTRQGIRLVNPLVENPNKANAYVRPLMPVYPLTGGINQHQIRKVIQSFEALMKAHEDPIPEAWRKKWGIVSLPEALVGIHVPDDWKQQQAAARRLAFDELMRLHLAVLSLRDAREQGKAPKVEFNESFVREFVGGLPFTLTDDQKRSSWAAIKDMEKGSPMNRLVDGDVGSGKTAVAAVVAANAIASGYQAALMAPTEILAKQHFATLRSLFAHTDTPIVLWTNSFKRSAVRGKEIDYSGKRAVGELQALVSGGDAGMVVGTHALTESAFSFSSLALAVVDEQHRFGVRARKTLTEKSGLGDVTPHLLSMTATPIPRSLALTIFGDLDLSLLRQKPGGRQPIVTAVCLRDADRQAAYAKVREQCAAGRQAFVVCPLIEANDKLGVASVTETAERLSANELADLRVSMMHGKLSADEKERVMSDFAAGKSDVLVSTSVVEVGVDVPNATVMCIEGAERFGLAQLHQFRGRVGRSEHASTCFLLPTEANDGVADRLEAFARTDDGFSLAELDLKLRGPGDLLGERQSGFPALKAARITDVELVSETKGIAEELHASGELKKTGNEKVRDFLTIEVGDVHLE